MRPLGTMAPDQPHLFYLPYAGSGVSAFDGLATPLTGAVVAVEFARALQNTGRPLPVALILSGSNPPVARVGMR
tara:strand:- start:3869 stop:4090 length:222 start_codon:yes stop_codon:yes gene_type:complete